VPPGREGLLGRLSSALSHLILCGDGVWPAVGPRSMFKVLASLRCCFRLLYI
jgi:hypothetical protein